MPKHSAFGRTAKNYIDICLVVDIVSVSADGVAYKSFRKARLVSVRSQTLIEVVRETIYFACKIYIWIRCRNPLFFILGSIYHFSLVFKRHSVEFNIVRLSSLLYKKRRKEKREIINTTNIIE